jgi:phosphoribosylformylglycinamidine synthase
VIRVDEGTGRGVAVALRGPARFAALDPYEGARLALAEAFRAVACTGAEPVAVTDGLNAGSPEDPESMWAFAELVRGLAAAAAEFGLPVTGGNVSLYNATGERSIHPTAMVGVLGVLERVAIAVPAGWELGGLSLHLLGVTGADLAGSAAAWEEHRHLVGRPPRADAAAERALADALRVLLAEGSVESVRDVAEGGLLAAITEGCLRFGVGARLRLDDLLVRDGLDLPLALLSETPGRALMAVPVDREARVRDVLITRGVPDARIGLTGAPGPAGEAALEVAGVAPISLADLRAAHEATLPGLYG